MFVTADVMMNMINMKSDKQKKCGKCDEMKQLTSFSKNRTRPDGHDSWCKSCRNARTKRWYKRNKDGKAKEYRIENKERDRFNKIKRLYGISKDEYYSLLSIQGNKCPICGLELNHNTENSNMKPCVDHCHFTNKVRGILHDRCNRLLGLVNDDIEILDGATKYLLDNKEMNIAKAS